MIGKMISHYKILEKLGEGGMGVVYKAEDTKLDRMVALKFLPTRSLGSEEDRKRFEQEAKAAAALNHPNIATIYEINEYEGDTFIAMEYVDGVTLTEKIKEGPLKIKNAMNIAKQVADGLNAAHEKGVFHRDIKSSNIMLTKKNQVKILDFGLAKIKAGSMVTKPGTMLGTIACMSPEQARGEEVDHRTDIWSLGVIFYEMIAGQLPFKGEYESAMIYSIMNLDPEPLTGLRTGVPMDLEKIINKLLEKDPDDRYQNVIELPVDLKAVDLTSTGTSAITTTATMMQAARRPKFWKKAIVWQAATVVVAIIASISVWFLKPQPELIPHTIARYNVEMPEGVLFGSSDGHNIALSPYGKYIAYIANDGEGTKLFLYNVQTEKTTILPGTEGANNPIFSPDGKQVGFYTTNMFKRIGLTGENPIPICEVGGLRGATWGPDNTIIYGSISGLYKVLSSGNELPEKITVPDTAKGITQHRWPEILPDGKSLLFTKAPGNNMLEQSSIAVLSLESMKITDLNITGGVAKYASSGQLIYGLPGRIMGVSFDIKNLKTTDDPKPLYENVYIRGGGASSFGFSKNGMLVFYPISETILPERTLVWVDRHGNDESVIEENQRYQYPRLSSEGSKIVMEIVEDNIRVIYTLDIESRRLDRFSSSEINSGYPIWTPDNKNLIFYTQGSTPYSFLTRPVNRSRESTQLLKLDRNVYACSISPTGNILTFIKENPTTNNDIWVMQIDDSTSAEPFYEGPGVDRAPVFSPDGKWIAYSSDEESGQFEVYVRPYPPTGGWHQVSNGGGHEPMWGADMKELFFRQGTKMMSAPIIETEPEFKMGKVEELFDEPYLTGTNFSAYDYDPLNDRFLMVKYPEGVAGSKINVVVNWFEELKEKFRTEKK